MNFHNRQSWKCNCLEVETLEPHLLKVVNSIKVEPWQIPGSLNFCKYQKIWIVDTLDHMTLVHICESWIFYNARRLELCTFLDSSNLSFFQDNSSFRSSWNLNRIWRRLWFPTNQRLGLMTKRLRISVWVAGLLLRTPDWLRSTLAHSDGISNGKV